MDPRVDDILQFWFGPGDLPRQDRRVRVWFVADPGFDKMCADGFLDDYRRAPAGQLDNWKSEPRGMLALILLLDQFPRNLFRGSAKAFATDAAACASARDAIAKRFDLALEPIARWFIYMPFMHAESLEDQDESVHLFRALADTDSDQKGNIRYAEHHREVIRRFGRFPHRNAILGRLSTAAEKEFLARESDRR
jgi:uncharacterized protein (DUF924 family)